MKKRIAIIGAGISGLAAGYYLRKKFGNEIELTIFEKEERPGGWVRTLDTHGFIFEKGPNSCRSTGTGVTTLQLSEALGIEKEVLVASTAAHRRYLQMDGELCPLPTGFFSLFTSKPMRGLWGTLWKELWMPKTAPQEKDESIYEFFSRRFGEEFTERLIDPMTLGIYAGDIRKLSMRSCFPTIWKSEEEHGSILRSFLSGKKNPDEHLSPFVKEIQKSSLFTYRHGMETLVKALAAELKNDLRLGYQVSSLKMESEGLKIECSNGKSQLVDHLFFAASSRAAKRIMPMLFQEEEDFASASIAVISLGWNDLDFDYQGFGYLVPSSEKQDILGMIWASSAFPEQNRTPRQVRFTVMLGGAVRPDLLALSSQELVDIALDAVNKQLKIKQPPDVIDTCIAKEAIPQYYVGHYKRVDHLEERVHQHFSGKMRLLGGAWHGVSVNDCIHEASCINLA